MSELEERIAALEREVAEARERIAALEAGPDVWSCDPGWWNVPATSWPTDSTSPTPGLMHWQPTPVL